MYRLELDEAIRAAKTAAEISMKYWNTGLIPESKADDSPVTIADKECEKAITEVLTKAFPEDGMLGEEGANRESRSGRRWIIDPIDGTKDFIRGNRAWATLIALEDKGEVVAGVTSLPATGEIFAAAKGEGATCNGKPIRVSNVAKVSEAVLCLNGIQFFKNYAFAPKVVDFASRFWSVRSFGGCVDAMMLAQGQAEIWIEPVGKAWDFAPLKIIAEEAGASFFNFDGGRRIDAGHCVLCVPALEEVAREFVRVF